MCDYSLAYFPNRLAVEGEQLVVHRFPCGTLGLASSRRTLWQRLFPSGVPAVCIPPGARLRIEDIAQPLQRRLGIEEVEEVTFVQQSAEAFTYRDAVRFVNGREILLQRLPRGLRVEVLSLGGSEESGIETKEASGTGFVEATANGGRGMLTAAG
jgi:hypothetical protein